MYYTYVHIRVLSTFHGHKSVDRWIELFCLHAPSETGPTAAALDIGGGYMYVCMCVSNIIVQACNELTAFLPHSN